jgi:hypothetical protein
LAQALEGAKRREEFVLGPVDEGKLVVPAHLDQHHSVKPASTNFRMAVTNVPTSDPQGMEAATSSGRTNCEAPAKA